MAELIIRQAEEKDIKGIELLEIECFSSPWSYESLKKDICENNLALYLVAEVENKVVGYIGIWDIVDEGHITNVAVSKAYRRRHIGAALIKTMIEVTEEAGILSHTLEVRKSNEAAKNLYKQFGFQEIAVRPGYYEDNGEDAILMWRNPPEYME